MATEVHNNDKWDRGYTTGRDYTQLSSKQLDRVLARVNRHVVLPESGGRALDFGCGTGQLAREMCERGFSVVGADTSRVGIAQAIAGAAPDTDVAYVHLVQGAPVGEQIVPRFDVITCKYVYPFIADKERFVADMAVLLRSAGVFILMNPRYRSFVYDRGLASYRFVVARRLRERFVVRECYREALHDVYICTLP